MTEPNFRSLKMQVLRRVQYGLQLAEQHFKRTFPVPNISYQVRGVKAGVAYLQQNEIRLNPVLLQENAAQFIQQVVLHELAHLITYQVYGRVKPHGQEWQFVMEQVFGLPADTCHQFDVENVQGQTFPYRCGCQIHQLSIRRHNKIQRESAVYFCRKCKQALVAA